MFRVYIWGLIHQDVDPETLRGAMGETEMATDLTMLVRTSLLVMLLFSLEILHLAQNRQDSLEIVAFSSGNIQISLKVVAIG